jgi:hypothetical protein
MAIMSLGRRHAFFTTQPPEVGVRFNPDYAVGADSKREAQSFRSEDDGLLTLPYIDQHRVEGMLEVHRYGVLERKIIWKLRSRTPSLLQDCASLPPLFGLTAESGCKELA